MRHLLLLLSFLLPFVVIACADTTYRGYAYNDGSYPTYSSGYGTGGYYGRPYYGSDNCGTPSEYKPCGPTRWYPRY